MKCLIRKQVVQNNAQCNLCCDFYFILFVFNFKSGLKMPTLFITTLIKGVSRHVKFTEAEQDAENFEENFIIGFIDKGMKLYARY